VGRGAEGHSRRTGGPAGPGGGRLNLRDSRRLTGPNLLGDRAAAVIDADLAPETAAPAILAWSDAARRILSAVGWGGESLLHRAFPHGASLAVTAPVDALYAATEVNEWAWEAARARLAGEPESDLAAAADRLRGVIATEGNPLLLALREAARERGVLFLSDDHHASVGSGTGSLTWPARAVPEPGRIDWTRVHDVPIALVTGTNGKTTTVRALAAMAEAAGYTPGVASTDWIQAGREILDRDDWSGPGGARRILREPGIDLAVLETARGGILRRGLAVDRADAAIITNVAEDHLGEWGVQDLAALAEVKLVVSRVCRQLVLNAGDRELVRAADRVRPPVTWFSTDPGNPVVRAHREGGGRAAVLEDGVLVLYEGSRRRPVVPVADVPMTVGGAARYNVANALGAIAAAAALGLSPKAMAAGLCAFTCSPESNPGRLNVFPFGTLRVLVDYAHNPHGLEAVAEMARALGGTRRLVLLGQAGDRTEDAIRTLARTVWRTKPDRIVIKEMREHLRGRSVGEVPAILLDELRTLGAPPDALDRADSELSGVTRALAWARPGDLLLLFCHAERDAVIALLRRLQDAGWTPGHALPES
jgi:UDP-N-acetylmuramyl tripeptide synthase